MRSSKFFSLAALVLPVFATAQEQGAATLNMLPGLKVSAQSSAAQAPAPQVAKPGGALVPGAPGTVEELLDLDAKIALEKLRQKAADTLPPAPPPPLDSTKAVVAADVVDVQEILGYADSKRATIHLNGQPYTSVRVGSKVASYKVKSIGMGCVELEKATPASRPVARAKPRKGAPPPKVMKACFDQEADAARMQASLATASVGGTMPSLNGGARPPMPMPLPALPPLVRK